MINMYCGITAPAQGSYSLVRVRSRDEAGAVKVRGGGGAGAVRKRQKSGCDVGAVIPQYSDEQIFLHDIFLEKELIF